MSIVRKADFLYGSLLSVLINNGLSPVIIESGDTRSIYSISTNDSDYEIYAKYVSASNKGKKKDTKLWQFSFTQNDVEKISMYQENGKKFFFALICGEQDRLQDSEIAFLSLPEIRKCLDIKNSRKQYRLTVKTQKGKHGLQVYGTGLSDEDAIRIERDRLCNL